MKSVIAAISSTALMMIGCAQAVDTPAAGPTVASGAGARAYGIAGYELAFGADSIDVGLRGERDAEVGRITLHTQSSFFLVAELDGHVITTEASGVQLTVTMDGVALGAYRVDGDAVAFAAAQELAGDGRAESGLTLEAARPYLDVIGAVMADPALQQAVNAHRPADVVVPYYADKFCFQMGRGCDAGSEIGCGAWFFGGCWLT